MSTSYPSEFNRACAFSLREEVGPFADGGYLSPHDAARLGDPGGETKWGISKRSYPHTNIELLTREQAIEIYFHDYWASFGQQRSRCDVLAWPLSFAHFDCAVNVGNRKYAQDGTPVWHGNANKILQRAAGVEDDGYIGPVTLAAIANHEPLDLALKAISEREKYYRSRGPWADRFRAGWLKRTARVIKEISTGANAP